MDETEVGNTVENHSNDIEKTHGKFTGLKVDFVTLACSAVSVFCNFLFSQTSTCVANYCMETQKMLLFLNTCSYTACKLKE